MKKLQIRASFSIVVTIFIWVNLSFAEGTDNAKFTLPAFSSENYSCTAAKGITLMRLPSDDGSELYIALLSNVSGSEFRGNPALLAFKNVGKPVFVFTGIIKILPCDSSSNDQPIIISATDKGLNFNLNEEGRLTYAKGQGSVSINGVLTELPIPDNKKNVTSEIQPAQDGSSVTSTGKDAAHDSGDVPSTSSKASAVNKITTMNLQLAGVVESVNVMAKRLSIKTNKEVVVFTTDDNATSGLAEIKVGDKVSVKYSKQDDKNVASSILQVRKK